MDSIALVSLLLVAAQGRKVNAPLATDAFAGGGDVYTLAVSPDGAWVAYLADQEVDERLELYSAPLDGSAAARKLSAGKFVYEGFQISAGAQRAVYLVAETTGKDELYSAPIDGSAAPVRLNGTLPTGGDVLSFVLSPDGARTLYLADQSVNERFELWSVPTDRSSAPVRVNGTLVTGGDVRESGESPLEPSFGISPDGAIAVYLADQDTDGVVELYSAPSAGGAAPVRLNAILPAGGNVLDFRIAPDSQRVVYRADRDLDERFELYAVPLAGGTPVKLNGTLPAGGDVSPGYEIDPLSTRVAYLADEVTNDKIEVFASPLDGSSPSLRLNAPLIAQGDVTSLRTVPGGQRLAYLADADVDGRVDLFAVGLDGSAPVKLDAALPPGGNVGDGSKNSVLFSGDGTRAVYWADQETDEVIELYSVPMTGGTPVKISGSLVAGGNVSTSDLRVAADGARVLFRADKVVDELFELWNAPLDGSGAPLKLSGTLVGSGDVLGTGLGIDPANLRVAYLADAVVDERTMLWSSRLAGGPSPRKLNGPLLLPPIEGDVESYTWSPDGKRVMYVADQAEDGVFELFSWRKGGFAAPRPLNGPVTPQKDVWSNSPTCLFEPDGERVIFWTSYLQGAPEVDGDDDLFSAPRDGSQPASLIDDGSSDGEILSVFPLLGGRVIYGQRRTCCSGPPPSWHIWNAATDGSLAPFELTVTSSARIWNIHVTPQEDMVLYSDLEAGVYALRAVPVNASSPPVAIAAPLASLGTGFNDFQVAPGGDRVIFVGAFGSGDPDELWSVPVTGGPPVRLSPPLAADRDVDPGFRITPDGTRVLYRADQDTDEVNELYSVPAQGGASVKLSGAMTTGGDVDASSFGFEVQFVVAPGGTRVIYRADQMLDGVYELFSAPVDGSVPATRLNPPLSADRDVARSRFLFTLDGQSVVYAANQDASTSLELYVVAADGTQAPQKLNPPMVANGGLGFSSNGAPPLALSLDGGHIVYLADQLLNETYELFSVPLDGSQTITRLNGALVAGGDVWSFELGPTGDILYLADEEHDDVRELYLTRAHFPPRRSGPP